MVTLGKGGNAIDRLMLEEKATGPWSWRGTEVAFAFWQVGPCLMCGGDSGSEICQHCRKKSSGCEQNSPAPLQTGKQKEMGL